MLDLVILSTLRPQDGESVLNILKRKQEEIKNFKQTYILMPPEEAVNSLDLYNLVAE